MYHNIQEKWTYFSDITNYAVVKGMSFTVWHVNGISVTLCVRCLHTFDTRRPHCLASCVVRATDVMTYLGLLCSVKFSCHSVAGKSSDMYYMPLIQNVFA